MLASETLALQQSSIYNYRLLKMEDYRCQIEGTGLADRVLHDLITAIKWLNEIEASTTYTKLSNYGTQTDEEIERNTVYYSDPKELKEFFDQKELHRFEVKTIFYEEKGKEEFIRLKEMSEDNEKKFEVLRAAYINSLKKDHDKTLRTYAFLSDIIGIFCPFMLASQHK